MVNGPGLFGYLLGNPVRRYDPLGLCGEDGVGQKSETKSDNKDETKKEIKSILWSKVWGEVTAYWIDLATRAITSSSLPLISDIDSSEELKTGEKVLGKMKDLHQERYGSLDDFIDSLGNLAQRKTPKPQPKSSGK